MLLRAAACCLSLVLLPGTATLLPGLNGTGNADFVLDAGNLAAHVFVNATVDKRNKVTPLAAAADLKLTVTLHPVSKKVVSYKDVVHQRQQRALGFFFGPTESGSELLEPD